MQRLLGPPASQKASRPPGAGREALTRSRLRPGVQTKVCIIVYTNYKGHKMNNAQEVDVLAKLEVAYAIIMKISKECKYQETMSMMELVHLQIALLDAKRLIGDDVIAKMKN